MAYVLLALHRKGARGEWVYLPDLVSSLAIPQGGDYAKLRFWRLIESKSAVEGAIRSDGSKRVGWWRITPQGKAFVRNMSRLPKHLHTYNNDVVRQDELPTINIVEALGEKFNYADIMS